MAVWSRLPAAYLFPSLYTNAAQLSALGIKGDSDEKRRAAVEIGISRLLQMQRNDGGLPSGIKTVQKSTGSPPTSPISWYVRASRVTVDVINNANSRLLRYLQDPGMMAVRYSEDTQASKFAIQAYARAGAGTPAESASRGIARNLGASSASKIGPAANATGTGAEADGGCAAQPAGVGSGNQNAAQQTQAWMADYGSPLRDNAMMLSLLEEYNLLPDAQNTLLNALSQQAFSQRWLSTQESNALFLAGRSLQTLAGDWQATTTPGGEGMRGNKPQVQNLNADQLAALQVTNTGTAPLWVRLDSSGYHNRHRNLQLMC